MGAVPVVEPLFLAVWLLAVVNVVAPARGLVVAATALLAVLLAVALPRLKRQMWPLAGSIGLAAVGIAGVRGDWRALVAGVESATVFVAFFGTLIMLRATADRRPETARARTLFASLPADRRAGATLYGSYLLAAVLVVGAHAIMAPIHGAKAPEPARQAGAVMSQRGLGLAGLWSPFWLAMALVSRYLPGVPLWSIVVLGIALSVPGLLIGNAMADGSGGRNRIALDGLAAFAPAAPPVLIAAAAVVALASFTRLGSLEALVTAIPVLCLVALAPLGGAVVRATVRTCVARTGAVLDELVLVAFAFMLGRVLVGVLADVEAAGWLAGNMPPPAVVIAVMIGGPTLFALIGVHQIVTITVLLVLLSEVPSGVADLVLMEAALIAWAFASMIGLSAISTVAASALFGVRLERLAWGPNVAFAAVFGVVAVVALAALNAAIA